VRADGSRLLRRNKQPSARGSRPRREPALGPRRIRSRGKRNLAFGSDQREYYSFDFWLTCADNRVALGGSTTEHVPQISKTVHLRGAAIFPRLAEEHCKAGVGQISAKLTELEVNLEGQAAELERTISV
jgi:hypothetical protein